MNKKLVFKTRPSSIVALCIVSESEIAKVIPDYSFKLEGTSNFLSMLHSLGMDTLRPFIRQDAIQHRNRLNEVVVCSRWVGEERIDESWLLSGYASTEAKDKATGSKILEDLYRSKHMTEDAQRTLEDRDRYNKSED